MKRGRKADFDTTLRDLMYDYYSKDTGRRAKGSKGLKRLARERQYVGDYGNLGLIKLLRKYADNGEISPYEHMMDVIEQGRDLVNNYLRTTPEVKERERKQEKKRQEMLQRVHAHAFMDDDRDLLDLFPGALPLEPPPPTPPRKKTSPKPTTQPEGTPPIPPVEYYLTMLDEIERKK